MARGEGSSQALQLFGGRGRRQAKIARAAAYSEPSRGAWQTVRHELAADIKIWSDDRREQFEEAARARVMQLCDPADGAAHARLLKQTARYIKGELAAGELEGVADPEAVDAMMRALALEWARPFKISPDQMRSLLADIQFSDKPISQQAIEQAGTGAADAIAAHHSDLLALASLAMVARAESSRDKQPTYYNSLSWLERPAERAQYQYLKDVGIADPSQGSVEERISESEWSHPLARATGITRGHEQFYGLARAASAFRSSCELAGLDAEQTFARLLEARGLPQPDGQNELVTWTPTANVRAGVATLGLLKRTIAAGGVISEEQLDEFTQQFRVDDELDASSMVEAMTRLRAEAARRIAERLPPQTESSELSTPALEREAAARVEAEERQQREREERQLEGLLRSIGR